MIRFGLDFDEDFDPDVVGDVTKIAMPGGEKYWVKDSTARVKADNGAKYHYQNVVGTAPSNIFTITTPGAYNLNSTNIGGPFGNVRGLLVVEQISSTLSYKYHYTIYSDDGYVFTCYTDSNNSEWTTYWENVGRMYRYTRTPSFSLNSFFGGNILADASKVTDAPSGAPTTGNILIESFIYNTTTYIDPWVYQRLTYYNNGTVKVYLRYGGYNAYSFSFRWESWVSLH